MREPSSRNSRRSPATPILLVGAILMTSVTGCSLFDGLFGEKSYRGIVSLGFEVVSFTPCRGDEQWWMTGDEALRNLQTAYNSLTQNPYEPVYAELEGERSGRGEYGHLGAYQREFEVTDVIEVRLPEEGECGR